MALKKIFWTQIDTEFIPPSEQINIGTLGNPVNDVYSTDLWINGINIDDYFTDTNIWLSGDTGNGLFYSTTNDLQVTGSMTIKGDLLVEGKTTLVQTENITDETLIVSGAMKVMQNEIGAQIASASLLIEGLGTLGARGSNEIIDLGFF